MVYLGTHDNNTARGWFEEEANRTIKARLLQYIEGAEDTAEVVGQLIELTLASTAKLAIVTAQDLLALPSRTRMNDPSVNFGNWKWRLTQKEFDALTLAELGELTRQYQRV